MKTLVIGCGSIGSRHARNLAHIKAGDIVLADLDVARAEALSKEVAAVGVYATCEQAFEAHSDIQAVVISTPTSLHATIAHFFIERGVHIFMEKPLSSTLEEAHKIQKALSEKNLVFMMAQSFRFHEGFLRLKEIIDSGKIGRPTHVTYYSGQYLPDWHPSMDYRQEYAAQKKLGGGVMLTSMSHVFDFMRWLFGDITSIVGWKDRVGDLEIDVDDSVFCLLKTDKGTVIQAESDFLQRKHTLTLIAHGTEGTIFANFMNHTFHIHTPGDHEETETYITEVNKRYVEELKHFVHLVEEKKYDHDLNIDAGVKVMELIYSPHIADLTK